MTGKTHLALGGAAALSLSIDMTTKSKIIILGFSLIGSLIPDLDHPSGKINQKLLFSNTGFSKFIFYFILGLISFYFHYTNGNEIFLPLGIMSIALGYSTHRSFTHSLLGLFGASIIMRIFAENYNSLAIYYGFLIGYSSHLIADYFNPRGIKLFYPLKKRYCAPFTLKTGGKLENKLFVITTIYSIFLLFISFEIFKY